MKNYEGYINHLKSSRDYWKRIALAEREDGKTLTREEELTFIQKELMSSLYAKQFSPKTFIS